MVDLRNGSKSIVSLTAELSFKTSISRQMGPLIIKKLILIEPSQIFQSSIHWQEILFMVKLKHKFMMLDQLEDLMAQILSQEKI